MTIAELKRKFKTEITPKYGAGEADAISRLAFHALYGWDTTQYILRSDREASEYMQHQFASLAERLKSDEPVQYILGEAYFYGMVFKVAPGVLIPRPETAELVDWIVDECSGQKDLRVLDVGTGSGCIAVSLSLNLPFSAVTALDINPKAISLASENAERLHGRINAVDGDIFKLHPAKDSFDVIVSNPPYIAESERSGMDRNVLDFEPENALFVPDGDPLKFYKCIAGYASVALCDSGTLYFEINPLFTSELVDYLEDSGWREVTLRKDISGKNRFLKALRPLCDH